MKDYLEHLKIELKYTTDYSQYDSDEYIKKCNIKYNLLSDIIKDIEEIINREHEI